MFHKNLVSFSSKLNNKCVQLNVQELFNLLTVLKLSNGILLYTIIKKKNISAAKLLTLLLFFKKTKNINNLLPCNRYINNTFMHNVNNSVTKINKNILSLYTQNVVDFVYVAKKTINIVNNSSSLNKYLQTTSVNNVEIQFLRKNKVFNKGRYSRCRQNYRTGVYLCMYLSVVCIFGLYFWFYKFSFNFSYLWWIFIAFVASFLFPKIIKYRLYEPNTILNKFFGLYKWATFLIKNLFNI